MSERDQAQTTVVRTSGPDHPLALTPGPDADTASAARARKSVAERQTPDDDFAGQSSAGQAGLSEVIAGLSSRPKTLPSKLLYDDEGSRLFDLICELSEYHVTRTELALLRNIAPTIAAHLPAGAALVEFGSGASVKTQCLLDVAPQLGARPINRRAVVGWMRRSG